MAAPPLAADLIVGGIVLNYGRSLRNKARARKGLPPKPTVSRWACRHKKAALAIGGGFFSWVLIHWALYVIELPED